MPWIATVSFGYVCLLSFTRGDFKEGSEIEPEPEPLQAQSDLKS